MRKTIQHIATVTALISTLACGGPQAPPPRAYSNGMGKGGVVDPRVYGDIHNLAGFREEGIRFKGAGGPFWTLFDYNSSDPVPERLESLVRAQQMLSEGASGCEEILRDLRLVRKNDSSKDVGCLADGLIESAIREGHLEKAKEYGCKFRKEIPYSEREVCGRLAER